MLRSFESPGKERSELQALLMVASRRLYIRAGIRMVLSVDELEETTAARTALQCFAAGDAQTSANTADKSPLVNQNILW